MGPRRGTAPAAAGAERSARAASHSHNAVSARIAASGVTAAVRKLAIGHRPVTAAATNCVGRSRPNSSPASSHAPAVSTSASVTDHSRIRNSRSSTVPPDAAQYAGSTYR